ncbi:hypothetical protein TD95_002035 [Thielaviopsis punctulata]|uniref:Uncharacterized protein n=1 Tax=Thielaviopsis punctulata TaxID=72032 RepID=A0A0F4ZAA7_9PEZI|nr:hypothetical protein TD95_002035 [Thielaviopsis punctulata]
MALFNPSFVFGVAVLLYLCSFVCFAILRTLTGISIQRLGYFSLRRISYTPRDGIRIDIRGLGIHMHRPTFAQPTWLSIIIDELAVTVNRTQLENSRQRDEISESASESAEPSDSSADPLLPKPEKPSNLVVPPMPTIARNGDDITTPIDPTDPFDTGSAPIGPNAAASNESKTTPGSAFPSPASASAPSDRSKMWEKLTKLKERIKKLHRNVKWLRMVDIVATNSSMNLVGVGNMQFGSFSMAVDTRSKLVDRTRFFNVRADSNLKQKQAEWSMALRSVLFTPEGKESIDIVDNATLNIHGFLFDTLDGLRDASVALKLGRVHVPVDDISMVMAKLKKEHEAAQTRAFTTPMADLKEKTEKQHDSGDEATPSLGPGFTHDFFPKLPSRVPTFNTNDDKDLMRTIADSQEFVTSILRGIKEVQFAVSYVALSKKAEAEKTDKAPIILTVSTKEVGIDLHRLDPKSPAHRMYFSSNDIAHEALAAALSISVGLHDGNGKHERLVYIPMATTTMKTTLPSKTMELVKKGSPEERNNNILFANSVITSPSVDLSPHHIPLLTRLLKPKPKRRTMKVSVPETPASTNKHPFLIARLLPKANIKFSMHEPVVRISVTPLNKVGDSDDCDLIISSTSSVSLEIESFHSAVQEMHYSLAATMRLQTNKLYYQTTGGDRLDLTQTESFDMKVQVSAAPDVYVVVNGNVQTSTIKMVRPEIIEGLRQIAHQLRQDVKVDEAKKKSKRHSSKQNPLRALPSWLLHAQLQMSDISMEVAGTDPVVSDETRGVSVQLDSLMTEYRAQRLDSLQRRTSRRRTRSRSMTPDTDIFKAAPLSPTPRRKPGSITGDGRRLSFHVKGLEAYIIESIDRTEVEPFINCPRAEITLNSTSDTHGPVFHAQISMRALLVNWSLYRHYSACVAVNVLRKAFMRIPGADGEVETPTEPEMPTSSEVEFLSPPNSPPTTAMSRGQFHHTNANTPELFTFDVTVSLVQIKATMPNDPAMLVQVYGVEAGRHRWASPFMASRLIRLYVDSPRIETVWSRILSIKAARVDYRQAKKKAANGTTEEKAVELYSEAIRFAIPYEVLLSKITENVVNSMKTVQQLHYRFKTGREDFPFDKGPEGPKLVPKISIRTRAFLFEIEDGAFEWKLGMIYQAGQVEQQQRLAREEAFALKVKMVQEEESRRNGRHRHKRGQASASTLDQRDRDRNGGSHRRGHSECVRGPCYDPENHMPCISSSTSGSFNEEEARAKLNAVHATSWKQRIDRFCAISRAQTREFRSAFWGPENIPEDIEDAEAILEVPDRAALASALLTDLQITVDKPSFPMKDLADFMHKVGKGLPKDTLYTMLVPLNIAIETSEARISLRDYPLPFIHVPPLKPGQSTKKAAFSLTTDFVIAEEYRGPQSMRAVRVDVIKPDEADFDGLKTTGYFLEVRRTVGAVKTYSNMKVDVNTALPTRITWAPCYQPAIQDMMTVIETFTKPPLDPSERVGFWDKIRLSFHSRIHIAWRGDGDVHLALKGSRDPYCLTGPGAGFIMCWRNDVRLNLNAEDDPKRFMTVNSGEYVMAIPDYSHLERETMRRQGIDNSPPMSEDATEMHSQAFQKVVMKLGGNVQWMIGLVFEQAIVNGRRNFEFAPHYNVILREPSKALPDAATGLPYDAFRGFRSSHIHLSIGVRAPVDRDWMATKPQPSRSYNTVHMTPRFFTHFYQWLSLFGGPMSLPIRQGNLWPGREKGSKKFGRHLATLKYNLLLAPLFLTHIYKHKDPDVSLDDGSMATGIKVRFDSFMLDMHQRREEFNTQDHGRKAQSRTSGIKIHAAQLDLVSTDIRAVSATMRGSDSAFSTSTADDDYDDTGSSSINKADASDKDDDGPDNSRFTIPDNDMTWIDVDDFVELDWILPSERNLDTKILPLAFSPRLTYFRQTDIDGVISGDPDRTSPFGDEPTHFCIMSYDDDPRRVQQRLVHDRLSQLHGQMDTHALSMDDAEVRAVQRHHDAESMAQLDMLRRQSEILMHKKAFLEHMLHSLAVRAGSVSAASFDSQSSGVRSGSGSGIGNGSGGPAEMPELRRQGTSIQLPTGAEFESDYNNRFVVHNLHFKWNNELRNTVLRYFDQVSLRRGLVYYLSRPAVKFILDIVEEQERAKLHAPQRTATVPAYVAGGKNHSGGSSGGAGGGGGSGGLHIPGHGHSHGKDSDQSPVQHDADEAIRRLMEDGRRILTDLSGESLANGVSTTVLGHNSSNLSVGSARDFESSNATEREGLGSGLSPGGLDPGKTKAASTRSRRASSTNSLFFTGGGDSGDNGLHTSCSSDLTSGISAGFIPQKSYHVRLVSPQIQLQSDQNQKNVVLLTSKGMELKVVEVMDKSRLSDEVSGLVQRRFLVNMDSTQFFVTHRKWFQNSQLVAMGAYGGSSYGAPLGSMWPPWVPMEVMFDFETDPFGFKRVVQKTSGMMRYDKFNTLRLKYNDEINAEKDAASDVESLSGQYENQTSAPASPSGGSAPAPAPASKEPTDSRMDHLWVDFPQARALCNSSQYYAMYVIVLDLLLYNEPTEKTRNERLEKIVLASDFSDLSGIPETVSRMQQRIKQLELIRSQFQTYPRGIAGGARSGGVSASALRRQRVALSKDLAVCEEELFFMMKAITSSQRKHDTYGGGSNGSAGQTSTPLLRWSIAARDIVWHLVRDTNEPLVELQLRDVEYHRTDNSDGSHINLIQVGKILGLNLLPNALYPEIISPYYDAKHAPLFQGQKMIQVYWYMLEAIAGITVMEDFEVNLFPMRIQLERDVGKKLLEYIFPGMNEDEAPKDASPFIIKRGEAVVSDDEDVDDDDDEDGSDEDDDDENHDAVLDNEFEYDTRPTSFMSIAGEMPPSSTALELRLRPTLTSSAQVSHHSNDRSRRGAGRHGPSSHMTTGHRRRQKSLSIRTGPGAGSGRNLLRVPTKRLSNESLRSTAPSLTPSIVRPGLIRSTTMRPGTSSGNNASTNATSDSKTSGGGGGSGGRFNLRRRDSATRQLRRRRRRGSHSDDVTKMMARANKYMAFAHINVPSVLLCLSYKGKDSRNLEDVHDLVFRMPQIEWHNKMWSNLDLVEALKKAVIRALISHTGAIIGNKLRHRPNTAAVQSKTTATASSSVILSQAAAVAGTNPAGGLTPTSTMNARPGTAGLAAGYAESFSNVSDDAASVFGAAGAVDFSRSPPRSIRSSGRSIRPRSNSRSSSVHSGRTGGGGGSTMHTTTGFGPSLMPVPAAGSSSTSRGIPTPGFTATASSGSADTRSLHEGRPSSSASTRAGSFFAPLRSNMMSTGPQRPVTSASHVQTLGGAGEEDGVFGSTATVTAAAAVAATGGDGRRRKFREKLSALSAFTKLTTTAGGSANGSTVPASAIEGGTGSLDVFAAQQHQAGGHQESPPLTAPLTGVFRGKVTAQGNGREEMYLVEDESASSAAEEEGDLYDEDGMGRVVSNP